jgi:hypothetical protein
LSLLGNPEVLETMTHRYSALYLITLGLAVAGCATDAEVFDKTSAAVSELVGDACPLGSPPGENEVVIEHPEECGDAVCLGVGEQDSHCSCRCSGPEDGLPLCACPDSFHCQDDLIADLNLGSYYAGGYCVAD